MLSMEVQWVKYNFMVQWDDNNILLFKANSLKVKREEHLVMLVSLINAKH